MKFLWSFFIVLLLATCNQKKEDTRLSINEIKTQISQQPDKEELKHLLDQKIAEQQLVDSLSRLWSNFDSIKAFNHILDSINESIYVDKMRSDLNPNPVQNTTEIAHQPTKYSTTTLSTGPDIYDFNVETDTTVFIKGHIEGKAEAYIKINQTRLFKKDYQQTIVVNSEQQFEENVTIKEPGYYQLQHRQNKYDIFLTPGDSVELLIDHATDEGLHFYGETQHANNYLRCAYLQKKAMKTNEYDLMHQKYLSFKEQVDYRRQVKLNWLNELLDQKDLRISEAFIKQQKANINFNWARKHLKFQKTNMENPIATQTSDGKYFNELQFSSAYFDVYNYRKFLYEYFDFFSHKYIDDTYGKDGKYEYTPEERALKRYNRINFIFKDPEIRNFLKVNLVHDMIEETKKPLINPLVAKLKKDVKDKEYIDLIEQQYHKHVPIDDGVFAPNFVVKDHLGAPLKLNDLKGKWAYIAVWTTWCAPCKIEQPHLEILKKEYANNKNIEILSVSIDEEQHKWRTALKNRAITEPQYIAPGNWNSAFAEAFKLQSVPKYILIDPEGQINDLSTSKPSADIRLKFDVLGI